MSMLQMLPEKMLRELKIKWSEAKGGTPEHQAFVAIDKELCRREGLIK